MKRATSASLFLLCVAGAYLAQKLGWLPVLKYYPRINVWSFADGLDAEGPAMKWYGRILGCAVLGLAGWGIGVLIEKRSPGDNKALALLDGSAWVTAFGVIAFCVYYELDRWVL